MAKTYRFKIGKFDCISISDGYQPIDAELLKQFFVGASPHELHLALQKHHIRADYLELQFNCLLIDTGTDKILIDNGGGPDLYPHLGNLIAGLKSEAVDPENINVVILTHGHPDHVGGCIDEDGNLVFPNARYVMSRGEWTYWAKDADETVLGIEQITEFKYGRNNLLAITDQVDLIEPDTEIVPGIHALATPGHTRHHMSVQATSGGAHLICVADTMDLPIHVEHTNWHPAWDEQADQGIQTRRKLLKRAIEQNALIHGFHFPFPGVGSIREDGASWRFEPLEVDEPN
jgi:glyoxylase-like metal-dependent hydrolase (beta-lactamase superfamily II)